MFAPSLSDLLNRQETVVHIRLTRVRGSSPREAGAEMFITEDSLWGTIGGGQLEYMAIDQARAMLRDGRTNVVMDVPLGPEIGQCCGGRVDVSLDRMTAKNRAAALQRDIIARKGLPEVYILGAGHVGRALAQQFQHMPVRCVLIDSRAEELSLCTAEVEFRQTALPETDIDAARPGGAFIVLTHDHALDFLLTSTALARKDALYVGMIGSATKRVKFRNWARDHCDGQNIDQLICPIGADQSHDKRPAIIATFVVAEVMAELTTEPGTHNQPGTLKTPATGT